MSRVDDLEARVIRVEALMMGVLRNVANGSMVDKTIVWDAPPLTDDDAEERALTEAFLAGLP